MLFKIIREIVSSPRCRDKILQYFGKVLSDNANRTHMFRTRGGGLLGDGPMLNYLSVLQFFCEKVQLPKVDKRYPFDPNAKIDWKKESKIGGAETADYNSWVQKLGRTKYIYEIICLI